MVSNFLGTEFIKVAEQFIDMVRVYLAVFKCQGSVQCKVVYPFQGLVEVKMVLSHSLITAQNFLYQYGFIFCINSANIDVETPFFAAMVLFYAG